MPKLLNQDHLILKRLRYPIPISLLAADRPTRLTFKVGITSRNYSFQAEGYYGDSTFEVVVNGDTKGTVRVPGRDPSYVVTVGEVTSSIQFRQTAGGNAHIRSVLAVESAYGLPISVPVCASFWSSICKTPSRSLQKPRLIS